MLRFVTSCCLILALSLTGCKKPGEAKVEIPNTPDGTILAVSKAASEGKFSAAWDMLPDNYQSDISHLFEDLGGKLDKEMWDKGSSILGKAGKILSTKSDLILKNATVAGLMAGNPNIKQDDIKQGMTAFGNLITDLQSEVKTLDQLSKPNIPSLLNKLGSNAANLDKLMALQKASPLANGAAPKALSDLAKVKATVEKSDAKTATVKVTDPDGKENTVEMVNVKGKWLPKDLVEGWEKFHGEFHEKLEKMEITKEQKDGFMQFANIIEPALDGLLNAKDQKEFDTAVGSVMLLLAPLAGGFGGGM